MNNVISASFRNELLEGANKVIYQSETKGVFISYFKDQDFAIAKIRTVLCAKLFSILTACGVKNHFLCTNGIMEHKIIALDMLPFKFKIYSVVNDDLSKRVFLKPGLALEKYLIEIYFKSSSKNFLLSSEHLVSLGYLSEDSINHIFFQTRRIMDIVFAFFKALGLTVFSLSLSFGKQYKNEGNDFDILLGDELSLKTISLCLNESLTYNINDSYFKISSKLDFNV